MHLPPHVPDPPGPLQNLGAHLDNGVRSVRNGVGRTVSMTRDGISRVGTEIRQNPKAAGLAAGAAIIGGGVAGLAGIGIATLASDPGSHPSGAAPPPPATNAGTAMLTGNGTTAAVPTTGSPQPAFPNPSPVPPTITSTPPTYGTTSSTSSVTAPGADLFAPGQTSGVTYTTTPTAGYLPPSNPYTGPVPASTNFVG